MPHGKLAFTHAADFLKIFPRPTRQKQVVAGLCMPCTSCWAVPGLVLLPNLICINLVNTTHLILVTTWDPTLPNSHTARDSFSCCAYGKPESIWTADFLKNFLRSAGHEQVGAALSVPCTPCSVIPGPALVVASLTLQHVFSYTSGAKNHRSFCSSHWDVHKQQLSLAYTRASPKGPWN